MICPRCGYKLYCGCDNCIKRLPYSILPWRQDNDNTQCPACSFIESHSWWLDYEWDIATQNGSIEREPNYFLNMDGEDINYA